MKLLTDIARIRSGFPFRGKPERVETGGCRLVQMRNIDRIIGVVGGDLETIAKPSNWEDHRLQIGDILFTARGQVNNAGVFPFPDMSNAIAASTLLVIRANEDVIDPFYLTWYLNRPDTQEQLRTMQVGSSIPFIPIETLGQLRVPVPSMEVQGTIFELESLSQEEQALMILLRRKRRELVEGVQQSLLKQSK